MNGEQRWGNPILHRQWKERDPLFTGALGRGEFQFLTPSVEGRNDILLFHI